MVERYTVTVFVVGSTPILHTIFSLRLMAGQLTLTQLIAVRSREREPYVSVV